MKYLWARQHYKDGVANNWTPEEVSMQKDIEQWKSQPVLTETERAFNCLEYRFFFNSRIINGK